MEEKILDETIDHLVFDEDDTGGVPKQNVDEPTGDNIQHVDNSDNTDIIQKFNTEIDKKFSNDGNINSSIKTFFVNVIIKTLSELYPMNQLSLLGMGTINCAIKLGDTNTCARCGYNITKLGKNVVDDCKALLKLSSLQDKDRIAIPNTNNIYVVKFSEAFQVMQYYSGLNIDNIIPTDEFGYTAITVNEILQPIPQYIDSRIFNEFRICIHNFLSILIDNKRGYNDFKFDNFRMRNDKIVLSDFDTKKVEPIRVSIDRQKYRFSERFAAILFERRINTNPKIQQLLDDKIEEVELQRLQQERCQTFSKSSEKGFRARELRELQNLRESQNLRELQNLRESHRSRRQDTQQLELHPRIFDIGKLINIYGKQMQQQRHRLTNCFNLIYGNSDKDVSDTIEQILRGTETQGILFIPGFLSTLRLTKIMANVKAKQLHQNNPIVDNLNTIYNALIFLHRVKNDLLCPKHDMECARWDTYFTYEDLRRVFNSIDDIIISLNISTKEKVRLILRNIN